MKMASVKRAYRSEVRSEQALRTQRQILAAARELFVRDGYAATTVDAIAARARVSAPTVFTVFATKRNLLARAIDAALTGDDADVPVRERAWVREVQQERDQRRQIALIARNARAILERAGPLHRVIREAAASDPEIAALRDRHRRERLAGQTEFVRWVAANGPLVREARQAGEDLWALASPELRDLLLEGLGWSGDRYEAWLADALTAQLLPPTREVGRRRGASRVR